MSPMNPMEHQQHAPPRPGLRERKKRRTRTEIRRAAYRLIAEQGYEAATTERIAAAAEVSPSTVSRYFPVKEDIVLTGEHDPVMAEMLRARPAGEPPLESMRHVLRESLRHLFATEPAETAQRTRLLVEVPAVRARMTETMSETATLLTRTLAERTGRDPDDLRLRAFTAAVLGALREITLYWAERDQRDDYLGLIDETFDHLRGGLTLR